MEEMYVCFDFTTSTPSSPSHHHHHHPLLLSPLPPPPNSSLISPYDDDFATSFHDQHHPHPNHHSVFRSEPSSLFSISSAISSSSTSDGDLSSALRSRIAAHPLYPVLVDSYIDCQKVGAPPEIAYELEEIRRDNDLAGAAAVTTCFGADPELDEFMEWYCDILAKYRTDLAKPFDEATAYLNNMEAQLNSLCSSNNNVCGASLSRVSDEVGGSSSEDLSGGESADVMQLHCSNGEEQDLKDKLLRKYSGYISSLKHEFSKKSKKGKLPKDAKQMLLGWWSEHYKWPYPTESDKIALAECTGLDQKQINNWFINQRKRHWKPAENIQFAMMDSLCGPLYANE